MFQILSKFKFQIRAMHSFTQVLNPISGRSEWQQICNDYDYHQEVSNAAFADMLHDTERNQKYFAALKKIIKNVHDSGKKANVLDIGTGTGILSMMAVVSGADSVTACEAFLPMADCAEKIIEMNGMSDEIKLIKKRSTDIKVGKDGDMAQRANILVTEVFDTELIGEGAIGIFNHAHEHLLTEDSIVIPHSSTSYAQIIESPLAVTWNKPKLLTNLDGDVLLKPPPEINECQGECAVHDIQLSQIALNQFNSLVDPFPIFEFNWSSKKKIDECRTNRLKLISKKNGIAQVIFFWWDIKMDADEEIVLSCAPYWVHPDFEKLSKENRGGKKPIQNVIPWRDHWMQALYYLPKPINLKEQQEFYFNANHDEYSFWFDAWLPSSSNNVDGKDERNKVDRLKCTCSLHLAYSRSRIGQINNHLRNKKYLSVIEDSLDKNSNVLCLSDGSLIGLSTAAMGVKSVVCLEPHTLSRNVMESYVKFNQLKNVKIVKSLNDIDDFENFTHILSEPYFITSILPWDNFYFGTLINQIKHKLNQNKVELLPINGRMYALPVEFLDLHKIRSPLAICEGFDLTYFDKFIAKSTELAVSNVEAQPLWEYPCRALSDKQQILCVDFKEFEKSFEEFGSIEISTQGVCNGIAIWIDWDLNGSGKDKYAVTTGPTKPIEIGDYVSWDMYVRQGVHLVPFPKNVTKGSMVKWKVIFKPNDGELCFKFDVVSS